MHPAVFLDRDNTLIHNDGDLGDPGEVKLIQGAASAVASLCGLGFKVVVVSNQGGVARGKYKESDVDKVHRRINEALQEAANGARVDAFYFCPYHPEGKVAKYKREHPNRKPQPGMLLQAAEELGLDLRRSWTIGDQVRDIQAGAAAGTRTILLRGDADQLAPLDVTDLIRAHDETKNGEKPDEPELPSYYARSLVEAVRIIAQQRKPDTDQPPARIMAGERRWDAAAVAQLQRDIRNKTPRPAPVVVPVATPAPAKPFRPLDLPPPEVKTPEVKTEIAPAAPAPVPPPRAAVVEEAMVIAAQIDDEAAPRPAPPAAGPGESNVLRQILHEVRRQRGSGDKQFNYLTLTAIVLQTVAGVCLLGALWMGAADNDLFQRWAFAGLVAQGTTIALLLFSRHA